MGETSREFERLHGVAPVGREQNAERQRRPDGRSARIAEANGDRFRNANAEVRIDTAADATKHYVMLYESNGIIGAVTQYSLRFVYGENVLATPSEKLTFPKGVTPQPNLSADVFRLDGYRPTSYSSAVNDDGQTGVITVRYSYPT